MSDERPDVLWFNGAVVPWNEGRVHVWSELAIRGTSVFEGIRAYWHEGTRSHYLLALDEHLARLFRSARLLRLPTAMTASTVAAAIEELVAALGVDDHLYVRPTLYVDAGRYSDRLDEVVTGAYVVAFPVSRPPLPRPGVRCTVSSWRRMPDDVLPPRAKAGGAYLAFRLPLAEARDRGFDDAILLDARGKVTEATGAALIMVSDGRAVTPPLTAGVLESITRARLMSLLRDDLGVPVEEREIDRTELYLADEVLLCGTLAEVQPVVAVDNVTLPGAAPGTVTAALAERYAEICLAGPDAPDGWLRRVAP